MNTEFVKRERERMDRLFLNGPDMRLESGQEGTGMNRAPRHVATPQVAGVMASRRDVDRTPHAGQKMRRRGSQRHKGHKFTRFAAIGAIPRGVTDDSNARYNDLRKPARSDTTRHLVSVGELPNPAHSDLTLKYEPNGRNL